MLNRVLSQRNGNSADVSLRLDIPHVPQGRLDGVSAFLSEEESEKDVEISVRQEAAGFGKCQR